MSDEELITAIRNLGITNKEFCLYALLGIRNQLSAVLTRDDPLNVHCYGTLSNLYGKLLGTLARRG